ncbi:hypothetical protein ACIQBJ_02675 [Kitasatospora sp. NPDC088391]|uniref:hypothetical protein n=1 Tax=Kitasatospora sp. NPDC088391 TaxID=3364074 RepID=UPI0038166A7F
MIGGVGHARQYRLGSWAGDSLPAAAAVLDADGLWVEPGDDVELHLLLHELTPVAG